MHRQWLKYTLLSLLALVFLALTIFGFTVSHFINRPLIAKNGEPTIIEIDKSSSAYTFVHTLNEKQMITSPRFVLHFIRFQGFTSKLKAGIYQINPGESLHTFLNRVVAGDVLKKPFTIIEGTTHFQIDSNLKNAPYLKYNPNDWLTISSPSSNPEGLLLADTYIYEAGSPSKLLLQNAHKNLLQYLEQSWQRRSPNLPYKSSYELLIAASILEKEAGISSEKKLISGVIVNRLKKNMPLQVDPTVIYALGANYKGRLSHSDMLIESPYNTYRRRGLPPTPIAMVGKDAIDAAAHPAFTKFLYFVAKGDGSHHFSITYEEQKQAINRYLRN